MWTQVSHVTHQKCAWMYRQALAVILVLVLALPPMSQGSSCGDDFLPVENPKDGACGDMDIRNSVKNFRMLENCTVIEGSLHISLIDYVPQEEYDKYSFPLLREITGHLMMFRVFGLRTLRNLFPNLTAIRGEIRFFKDFALVAYEMRDLEELGLTGLTLVNGSVRLTRNHRLCHISSIDWGKLAPNVDPSKHLFVDNREQQLCPDFCNESCPSTTYQEHDRRRCWTSKPNDCQKNLVCACSNGRPCAPDGSCCNELCLGGCTGTEASDCLVCTKVVYQDKCRSHCPLDTFMLYNRRCLTKDECLNLRSRSGRVNRSDSSDNFPKLLKGNSMVPNQCVFKCPSGYMVKETNVTHPECIRCQGSCPKVCNTTKVSSIKDSEKLFGCSKIEGNLEIQITGGRDIDQELAKNLGQIHEVTGYVKIFRTYALLTLHFLHSLQIIGGEKSVHKGYSLFVGDNANLQEIFPEHQMKNMIIRKGRVGFDGNRRLCYSKISSFIQLLMLDKGRVDAEQGNNGNDIPCDSIALDLQVEMGNYSFIIVKWSEYKSSDSRALLNYVINYKEVLEPVKDIFKGRDACSDKEWKTQIVDPETVNRSSTTDLIEVYLIDILYSFTKYAIYVQATLTRRAAVSAISSVVYFQTGSSRPSDPLDSEVLSSDPHELMVRWKPPKKSNGVVTHYKVFYQSQSASNNGFEHRDFCHNPIIITKDSEKDKEKIPEKDNMKKESNQELNSSPLCCSCPLSAAELLKQQQIKELDIAFENDLHTITFQKQWSSKCYKENQQPTLTENTQMENKKESTMNDARRRRDVTNPSRIGLDFDNPIILHYNISDSSKNSTNTSTTESSLWQEVIVYDTVVTLSNLEHFHSYNIKLSACHETDPVTGNKFCSNAAIVTGQTAADPLADNLNSSLVHIQPVANKSGDVLIRWEPPPLPNGLILKYYLKYMQISTERSSIPVVVCVSAKQFQNNSNGYLLHALAPGKYSLQISAHSLAGNGSYTPELFFTVLQREEEYRNISVIAGVITSLVVVLFFVCSFIIYTIYKQRRLKTDVIVSPNPIYIPTDQLYAPDEWEVPRDSIRLIKELGQGSFGTVFEGLMEDPDTKVSIPIAIKTVNDKADFHERLKILTEASTMKVFECHHIVKLLGVVSRGQPALVVMELMALGDLRNYLRKCRPEEDNYPDFLPPTNTQIHQMAGEIADGMFYLSVKKIVHRDLAARNCLVALDGTVKIADFGMARDVYMTEYYRKDQKALLPVRWMAPESLRDGIFTTMSDIWSFGIVLWEMVTLAEQPYQGLGNDEVLRFVMDGRVMAAPHGCPTDLYEMMQSCWAYNPKHRPPFKSLLDLLLPYLNDHFHKVSYYSQEAAKSHVEDETAQKTFDGNSEQFEVENERSDENEASDADGEFGREDCLMVGGSQHMDDEDDGIGLRKDKSCTNHTDSLSSLPHQSSSYSSSNKERLPLMLHQQSVQELLLYPPSVSTGRQQAAAADLFSVEDDDNDSDNDFAKKDKKHIRSSKDAKSSSSERLKLLSDSPDNSRPKLELLLPAKPSQFTAKQEDSDYTSMSPASSAIPKVCNEISAQPTASSHLSMPSATMNNPPPFSFDHVLPNVASSQSPILHVNMEGIGNGCGLGLKQPIAVNTTGHEDNSYKPPWLFQNNHPATKPSAINSQSKLNDSSSNSNSNTNSIYSSSEGSKESSSSCGSHNRFNAGSANGHGPYTHQHTALC